VGDVGAEVGEEARLLSRGGDMGAREDMIGIGLFSGAGGGGR
jgi:hypothetical protein